MMTQWISVIFQQGIVKKIKLWCGLTTFGRGLLLVLLGMLTKGSASLVHENTISLLLTTIGIIAFITGIFIAVVGMDCQFKECKEGQLWGKKKR